MAGIPITAKTTTTKMAIIDRFKSRRFGLTALIVGGIVLFYVVIESLGITCPILYLTGISCACCGMSRAWIALLSGKIGLAFFYHPLFWVPPLILIGLLFWKRIPKRGQIGLIIGVCILFLVVYGVRLLDPADEIVVCRPKEGLIYRIFSNLIRR